ncbi:MAG: Lrp/AsnC ligand binding domain-containing protein [Candidatus Bathyarchaeota archaeon]|nr:Lrp/AsnC ligand binding domain-containing protein [Candidatus Bathyarchaeota archaeon]MDH5494961.1 Lrp/AsnC ligand binding domain-containing protein [Candidatus Bathyarchaeota archaeon]
MIEAYVLLRVKPGMDRSVFQTVKKLKQVKDMETVYGEYDLLMKIQVKTMDDLDAFIFDAVRAIQGVERTTTLITIEPPN